MISLRAPFIACLVSHGAWLIAGSAAAQPAAPPPSTPAPVPGPVAAAPPPAAPPPAAEAPSADQAGSPTAAAPAAPSEPGAAPPPPINVMPPPQPPPAVSPYDGPPLLFNSHGKTKLGAYGGLGVSYTHMLHRDGAVVDLSAAMLVEHRLSLGLAGYIFNRTPNGPNLGLVPREYTTAYGGFFIRYAVFSDFPVYGSIGALIGGGGLGLVEDYDREYRPNDDYDHDHHAHNGDFRGYFVFQPDISLHVNATRWLRFTATGGYRVATSVNEFGYDAAAMSGAVVGGKLEIGWF